MNAIRQQITQLEAIITDAKARGLHDKASAAGLYLFLATQRLRAMEAAS